MERERNKITSVCVYCASSTQVASAYREAATELGRLLGERNLRVINGAGNSGLMCAVSDATLAAGGTVTGVIPRFMVEQDWCHKGLTDLVEVDSMHERKQRMADLSDAVIALPGGCGTLEVVGSHHLETVRLVSQPDCHPKYKRLFRSPFGDVPPGRRRAFHAPAACSTLGGRLYPGRSCRTDLCGTGLGCKPP